MGFAEFVSQLVAETHQAVTSAQADQARQLDETVKAARLAPDEFGKRFISNAAVEQELGRLFPSRRKGRPHAVIPGGRLVARGAEAAAFLADALGPSPAPTEAKRRKTPQAVRLTRREVTKIRTAVRLRLATVRLGILKESVSRGMPRVLVDSGKITAKVTFRLHDLAAAKPEVRRGPAVPLAPLGAGAANLRVVVRQVDPAEAAGGAAAPGTAVGEVEITFKTMS